MDLAPENIKSIQQQSAQFQYKELYFIEWLAIVLPNNFIALAIPEILSISK